MDQFIASSILSSPQKISLLTINDGLPKTLLLRALSVFAKNSFSIPSEFAFKMTLSLSSFSSEHISEILGSTAGSLFS